MAELSQKRQKKRKKLFKRIVDAFEHKYSWLGKQASREMLLSAASWNINKYSDPPMRFRNHVMLAWDRGWIKSTLMRKMATVLGSDLCSTVGKVTDAAMRGSISQGQFMPPKPLKTPVVISTEFGQTSFDDELLNLFLNMLEEGHTNVSLNKIGSLPEEQKKSVEKEYDGAIKFGAKNEFTVKCNFVFWGATYDPHFMQDDALRSRFNVVTPEEPLSSQITKRADQTPPLETLIDQENVKAIRREIKSEEEVRTDFTPPDHLYEEYSLNPRESRDLQAHMASLNWWGFNINPELMQKFIDNLKRSRRIAHQNPQERVYDLIFDNPMTYKELEEETGFGKKRLHKLLSKLDADMIPGQDATKWVIYSRDGKSKKERTSDDTDELADFIGNNGEDEAEKSIFDNIEENFLDE